MPSLIMIKICYQHKKNVSSPIDVPILSVAYESLYLLRFNIKVTEVLSPPVEVSKETLKIKKAFKH